MKACPGLRSGMPLQSTSMPALHRRNVPNCRPVADGGMRVARSKTVARGLVPRWGRGGAWQNPPCQFAVPSHKSGFSYLGVPAPAGMSDCYESMSRTTIRDRPLRQPLIRHSGPSPSPFAASLRQSGPPFVIPAKAGIQKGWGGVRPPDDGKNPPVTPFSSSYAAFARPW